MYSNRLLSKKHASLLAALFLVILLSSSLTKAAYAAEPVQVTATSTQNVLEGDTGTSNAIFDINLSEASTQTVSVDYTTKDFVDSPIGATFADNDFVQTSGTVTFLPGETSKQIVVIVNGDTKVEPDEFFNLQLSNPVNAFVPSEGDAQVSILNDDINFAYAQELEVLEGDTTNTVEATVKLAKPDYRDVVFNYSTVDETAFAGVDYVATQGSLKIPAGQTSITIPVQILGNNNQQKNRQFKVLLSDVQGTDIEDNVSVITILDDDKSGAQKSPTSPKSTNPEPTSDTNQNLPATAVLNDFESTLVTNKNKTVKVPVYLSARSDKAVSIHYNTKNGDALAGRDFQEQSGMVVFQPGETTKYINIKVYKASLSSKSKSFSLQFSGATNVQLSNTSLQIVLPGNKKACLSKNKFTIRFNPTNRVLQSAKATLNGKKIKVKKSKNGRFTAIVKLRGTKVNVLKTVTVDKKGKTKKETRKFTVWCKAVSF